MPAHERAPDFFIVGAPKTGTTSLYLMLRKHPQIYMPDLKEPLYLASDLNARPQFANEPWEARLPHTLEAYLALFDDAMPQQLAGEATSSYLWSHTAASNIADLQPAARIIAILREPASLLYSFHLQCLRIGTESEKSLRKAISLEADRREGRRVPRRSRRPQYLQYSQHVRYVEQLQRYRARFAPEQMLVLIHDDFRADSRASFGRVLRFLDVDDTHPIPIKTANQSVGIRSKRVQALVGAISAGEGRLPRAARRAVKTLTPQRMRYRSYLIRRRLLFSEPSPPDESLMLELRRRFRPEVEAVSEYLGRDLVSLWGYDKLD